VGDVLTGLVRGHGPGLGLTMDEIKAVSLVDGIHFGLFLQKINILKDQLIDEREGRNLVPSRLLVRESLKTDAQAALDYVLKIPLALKGYRFFCAVALFLGTASLPYIEKSFQEKSSNKISRLKALALFTRIERAIEDNQALSQLYCELAEVDNGLFSEISMDRQTDVLEKAFASCTNTQEVESLLDLYNGPVAREDLSLFFDV
jgi:hypothetical protein